MASKILGRCKCPECDFESAHVKQAEGEGKKPYRYCPDCTADYHPRSQENVKRLLAKMRPEKPAAAPVAPPEPKADAGAGVELGVRPDEEAPEAPPASAPVVKPAAPAAPAERKSIWS